MQIRYSNIGTEPITQAEVKSGLKVDFATEDTLIDALITQIRELSEEASGLSLVTKTIEYFEEDECIIADWVKLPYPEHDSITEVVYNGETLTSDSYSVTGLTQKLIKITGSISTDADTLNDKGLKVTYTAKGTCPSGVKLAMLKEVAEAYERRGSTTEETVNNLTSSFYNYLQQFKAY